MVDDSPTGPPRTSHFTAHGQGRINLFVTLTTRRKPFLAFRLSASSLSNLACALSGFQFASGTLPPEESNPASIYAQRIPVHHPDHNRGFSVLSFAARESFSKRRYDGLSSFFGGLCVFRNGQRANHSYAIRLRDSTSPRHDERKKIRRRRAKKLKLKLK